jgi:hypothetical protein
VRVIWNEDEPTPRDAACHCGSAAPHDRDRCDERAEHEYEEAYAEDERAAVRGAA